MVTHRRQPRATTGGRGLTLRLLLLLPGIALGLQLFGFRRVYLFLMRHSEQQPDSAATDLQAEAGRIARTVVRVNRHVLPYESRCLLESLALLWLLRRTGIPAELFLGVRTIMGPFEAHAWVEWDGRVLNDVDGVRGVYEAFDLRALTAHSPPAGPQAQTT